MSLFGRRREIDKRLEYLEKQASLADTKITEMARLLKIAFISPEFDWVSKAVFYDEKRNPDKAK